MKYLNITLILLANAVICGIALNNSSSALKALEETDEYILKAGILRENSVSRILDDIKMRYDLSGGRAREEGIWKKAYKIKEKYSDLKFRIDRAILAVRKQQAENATFWRYIAFWQANDEFEEVKWLYKAYVAFTETTESSAEDSLSLNLNKMSVKDFKEQYFGSISSGFLVHRLNQLKFDAVADTQIAVEYFARGTSPSIIVVPKRYYFQ